MADYIIQKAVNLDAVKKKLQRPIAELERDYEAQRKYDGCCAVMFFPPGGGSYVKSRTGEENFALAQVARTIEMRTRQITEGFVLIGEAWHPDIPFNEISGRFRRYAEDPDLHFVANDCLTWAEFHAGHTDIPYIVRKHRLAPLNHPVDPRFYVAESHEPGTYDAQRLCNKLVAEGGYDGLILRDRAGGWTVGSGTTGEILKIKRVLSYDLLVTGIKEGLGKNAGRAGAISLNFDGKTLWCNCGTDAERAAWWADPTLIVGKIAEVEAMDISSEGLLREPRFKGIRHDKLHPDF